MGVAAERVCYHDGFILEALLESLEHRLLMLLLDDAGGGCKDSESILTLLGLGSLAQLEESAKKFRPAILCSGMWLATAMYGPKECVGH
jgi:hypothetical protein